ncbi:DUF6934 family protein [Pararcticibacter amylolyticus]|uniref:Uncharacterized protein n=1 Tax=Pararcticibacter amylolyticus TaxID=2173175 RepID=A0A2U2PD34_9SPHI|nr:hypothetical protein [Pararcticibacter amylolyticus]PWG79311.1 hypothetical protein DDR33_17470 [Pararcticibacter amylolyticus]
MQVSINFDDIYDAVSISDDLTEMIFNAPQNDGNTCQLLVKIKKHPDPHLPNVYNLGFGPPNRSGGFRDNVRLHHKNINKVFSTILILALVFLDENPSLVIGVDGSDDFRARFYHRMLKHNRQYLSDYFIAIGVDWYVRIFRDGSYEQNSDGTYIAKPRSEPFDYNRENRDLYRYYMFRRCS